MVVLYTWPALELDDVNTVMNPSCRVRFSIEDTGIGIKQEDVGKLFKIFGKLEQ